MKQRPVGGAGEDGLFYYVSCPSNVLPIATLFKHQLRQWRLVEDLEVINSRLVPYLGDELHEATLVLTSVASAASQTS